MDLFGRGFINNYTYPLSEKKEFNDFLHDIKNHILILQENDKEITKLINKNNNLIVLCFGSILSVMVFLVFFR